MGDAEITASSWKLVEVGRVILLSAGPYSGRLAVIVEIIDHKRVRFDEPIYQLPSVPLRANSERK